MREPRPPRRDLGGEKGQERIGRQASGNTELSETDPTDAETLEGEWSCVLRLRRLRRDTTTRRERGTARSIGLPPEENL